MTYAVHSVFATFQGEGARVGRRAVFLRLAGCNIWSGREKDRGPSCSAWCDTDFSRTETFESAEALADRALNTWGPELGPYIVVTGGEPSLQFDEALVDALQCRGFEVAVETNGSRPLPPVDWLTVSPKAGVDVVIPRCDELKVVWPQAGLAIPSLPATHRIVMPRQNLDGSFEVEAAAAKAREMGWRLGIQAHKFWGMP